MNTTTNKHLDDFNNTDFTLEFNVKFAKGICEVSQTDLDFEQETGAFTNHYAKLCFQSISKLNYKWIKDWSFAGRSNGWFVLLCNDKEISKIRDNQFYKIESIVEEYFNDYVKQLNLFYSV